MSIRIAIIDDQALVRGGICSLLRLSDAVEVVAEGDDGDQALRLAREHTPDVFLMDIRMPRMNGIEAIRSLRNSNIDIPVLILTTFDDHDLVLGGLQAGAQGYMLKDVSLENLLAAIETLVRGETHVQPAITETLLKGLGSKSGEFDALPKPEPLTPKELEVLRLVAGGYSNKEISAALHKSEGTVKNHLSNVLAKLGVRDRTRAVLRAIEIGLLG